MPELKRAVEDIASAVKLFEVGRARQSRFRRQVAATDGLLELLERLNLEEKECLGTAAARQVSRTLEALPPSLRLAVGPRTRVQRALDMVFDVQAVLFSWYVRGPSPLPADEQALSA